MWFKDELGKEGITIEDRYMIYSSKDTTYIIPYSHIRTIEVKGNKLTIYTGGVERMVITMKDENTAKLLLEAVLTGIEKIYLK
ncbi:MAG: hypothetical protein ACK4SM_04690 [Aquificaceae bacterium]